MSSPLVASLVASLAPGFAGPAGGRFRREHIPMSKKGKDPKRTTTRSRSGNGYDRHTVTRPESPEFANRRQGEHAQSDWQYRIATSGRRADRPTDRSPQNRRASLGGRGRTRAGRPSAGPAIGKAGPAAGRGRGNMLHLGEPGGRSAQGTEPQLWRCHPASSGGLGRQLRAVGEIAIRPPLPGLRGRVFAGLGKHIPHATAYLTSGYSVTRARDQPPYLPLTPRGRASRRSAGPADAGRSEARSVGSPRLPPGFCPAPHP